MIIGPIDLDKKVLVVAEIGNNHEGSYALAEEMIGLAAEAGADAVKFQTFRTDLYVSRSDEARYNRLKSFELSFDEFRRLKQVADRSGVLFISTPFDLESAQFLTEIVAAFKISSSDNTFYPLLELVAATGKPLIVSGGLSDMERLKSIRDFIFGVWKRQEIRQSLAILQCVTSYPVPLECANLAAIAAIRKALGCCCGYSDHTEGIEVAVLAVAVGARIIEKHFTINKHYSDFRDHQLSADPIEFRAMTERIRQAEQLLGTGEKQIQPCEAGMEPLVRRSIVARRHLSAGTCITFGHLAWVRPAGGLEPGEEYRLLGKKLKVAVKEGDRLLPEMLEGDDAL